MNPAQHFPEPTVGALIFDPEGRLLLLRSHKWGGKYVVPGGHVELGETLEAALQREVLEETGLNVRDVRFLCMQEFIYDPAFWQPRHFLFFDYACHTDNAKVRLNDEAQAYIWTNIDEALSLPIEPYTAKAIHAYLALEAAVQRPTPGDVEVELALAVPQERPVLENLMELYLYDFSQYDDADVGVDGRYGYFFLEHYWTEPGRYAFLFRAGGKLAGFALVRTIEAGEDPLYSMAEFFVMGKYRRRGVGRAAARALFDRFPGRWEVGQEAANLPSHAFWRKVIGEYTRGHYTEGWETEHEPVGPVQRFRAGQESSA